MQPVPSSDLSGLHVRRVRPAYQQVADHLREMIAAGTFPVGSRLPEEAELSAEFGAGRSTVREALRVLLAEGLIVMARGPRGGAYVEQPNADRVSARVETSLSFMTSTGALSIDAIIEARSVLEPPAAGLAAMRATPDQVARIGAIFEAAEAQTEQSFRQSNSYQFHSAVLGSAGNHLVQAITSSLFSVLRRRYLRSRVEPSLWAQVDKDHRAILEAVVARDPKRAETAMAIHLENLRSVYELVEADELLLENHRKLEES